MKKYIVFLTVVCASAFATPSKLQQDFAGRIKYFSQVAPGLALKAASEEGAIAVKTFFKNDNLTKELEARTMCDIIKNSCNTVCDPRLLLLPEQEAYDLLGQLLTENNKVLCDIIKKAEKEIPQPLAQEIASTPTPVPAQ